jgi:hypothetical protein
LTKNAAIVSLALSCVAEACTFKAPNANKPLGCLCDPRPNAYAYCKFDACDFAGCRSGFFDLDQQPSNGCETDSSQIPGNLVFALNPNSHALWYSEGDIDNFEKPTGIATATVADPACRPTTSNLCDFRLEAFQMSLVASATSRPPEVVLDDAIVGTTSPFTGKSNGFGVQFMVSSSFSASFGKKGDRSPLVDAKGSLTVRISPSNDGTVALSLSGNVKGYVEDRAGTLTFSAYGKTPQLFDASVPDAQPRDARADGDSALGDATSDDDATNEDASDQ